MFNLRYIFCVSLIFSPFMWDAAAGASLDGELYASTISRIVPDEFKYLLELRSTPTEFILPSGKSVTVDAELSHLTVRMRAGRNAAELLEFLLEGGLSSDGSNVVMEKLESGAESDTSCVGNRQSCRVTPTDRLSVVIDAARAQVRLIPAFELYGQDSGSPQYYSARNKNLALINKTNLYGSEYGKTRSFSLNDEALLGLPYGHIRTQFSLSDYDGSRSLYVDDLEYNLDIQGYRVMAGRSRNFNVQNTTSMLNFGSSHKEGVYIMSSSKLLHGPVNAYQRVYFYMPEDGVVEAWRDGRLLLTQPATPGQQYISYDKLPSGNYMLLLKLKTGENVLSEQQISIVNNPSVTLPTGQLDFTAGVADVISNDSKMTIAELNLAVRPLDKLQLATGLSLSESDQLYSIAGSWLFESDAKLDLLAGIFSDSATYQQSSISWKSTALTWQAYRASGKSTKTQQTRGVSSTISISELPDIRRVSSTRSMSELMLGSDTDYENVSLSQSIPFGQAYGYTNLYYFRTGGSSMQSSYSATTLSSGISFPFVLKSTLGVNLSASRNDSGNGSSRNDYSVGFNLTIPLGEKTSAISNVQFSDRGGSYGNVGVRRQFLPGDNMSASIDVGQRIRQDRRDANGSFQFSRRGDWADISSGGSISEGGDSTFYGSLNSTQVISGDGFFLTSEAKDSYLLVRNNSSDNIKALSKAKDKDNTNTPQRTLGGQVVMGSSDAWNNSRDYYTDSGTMLLPLERYRLYNVKLNADSGQLYNVGQRDVKGITLPGTVLSLSPKLEKEYQLTGVFWLPDGRPADVLTCEGESCIKVEKLDEGLFKISLGGQGHYKLRSRNASCVPATKPDTDNQFIRLPEVRCTNVDSNAPTELARTLKDKDLQAKIGRSGTAISVGTAQQ